MPERGELLQMTICLDRYSLRLPSSPQIFTDLAPVLSPHPQIRNIAPESRQNSA